MAETRKHSVVVKLVDSDDHPIVIDGATTETRPTAYQIVDPTISTEDHEITLTDN